MCLEQPLAQRKVPRTFGPSCYPKNISFLNGFWVSTRFTSWLVNQPVRGDCNYTRAISGQWRLGSCRQCLACYSHFGWWISKGSSGVCGSTTIPSCLASFIRRCSKVKLEARKKVGRDEQGDDSCEVWKHWLGGPSAQSMLDGAGKAGQAGKQFFAAEGGWAIEFLLLLHVGDQVHRALMRNIGAPKRYHWFRFIRPAIKPLLSYFSGGVFGGQGGCWLTRHNFCECWDGLTNDI